MGNSPDSWLDNAVLIYGPRKSGSTLLQNLLDGGNELFVYPTEIKIKKMNHFRELTEKEYQNIVVLPVNSDFDIASDYNQQLYWNQKEYISHNISNKINKNLFSREQYDSFWNLEDLAQFSLRDLIMKDVRSTHASSALANMTPKKWLAKEVGGNGKKVLRSWKRLFPRGRIILIRRNPVMVIRAIFNDRRRRGDRISFINILKQIFDSVRMESNIISLHKNHESILINYEDIVSDTEKQMKNLCEYLEIEYVDVFCKPTLFGQPTIVRTSSLKCSTVFEKHVPWHQDLTLREQFAILIFYPIARVVYGFPLWVTR